MKTKLLIASILTLGSLNLSAQVSTTDMIKAPLWIAPVTKTQTFKMESLNETRLKTVCNQYGRSISILRLSDPTPSTKRIVEQKRKVPHLDDWQVSEFEEVFLVSEESEKVEVNFQGEPKEEIDLPYYIQTKSEQRFDFEAIRELTYVPEQDSLSQFSRDLGLELEVPSIRFQFGKGYLIKVKTKDLACDFLNSKLKLTGTTKTFVKPLPDQIRLIENFYQIKMMKEFSNIMNLNISKSKKAVLLGYRIGGFIKDSSQNNNLEKVENDFLYLMDVLVDEKELKPSRYVVHSNNEYSFTYDLYEQTTEAQIIFE